MTRDVPRPEGKETWMPAWESDEFGAATARPICF